MDPETRTWKTRHEKIRATLADAGVLAVLTDEAAWRNVALTDTVLLDLALDLAAKHVDTSQNDLQDLFDALMELSSLTLSPEDFSAISTLAKEPQSSVSLVRASKALASRDRVWICKAVQKRWCAQMIGQTSPMHERDILLRATQHQREDVPRLLAAIQSNTELFIYLEFAPLGTMWDAMEASQDGRLEAELVACWMRQAGGAIHWLHEIGYAHRDIKPHNFLICSDKHLQLADFGSAAPLVRSSSGRLHIPGEYCACVVGTIDYIAPEVLLAHQAALINVSRNKGTVDSNALPDHTIDWWALGVVAYEALVGEAPFFAKAVTVTYEHILNHRKRLRKVMRRTDLREDARQFLEKCMTTAADRSSWLDLRQGRFLQERQEGVAAVPYSPPDSLRNRFVEEAMSPQTTTMPKAFDFSAFFSSPGLSALRSQQQSSSTHIKPTEQWIGFTHLPTADEFRNLLYRHELLSRAADHSPRVNQYLTPARPPSRSTSRSTSATPGISTTAKKRRPVTDLEAFNEVLEYGVLSVKRRQTPSSPDLFSNEKPKSADRTLTPSFLHLPGPAPVNDSVSSNPLRSFSLSVSESPPQQDTAKQRQRLERSDDLEPGSTAVSSEEERRRQADPMRPPPSLEELQQRQNRLLENCDDLESTYRRLLSLAGRN